MKLWLCRYDRLIIGFFVCSSYSVVLISLSVDSIVKMWMKFELN